MGQEESVRTNFGVDRDLSTSRQEIWQDVTKYVKEDGEKWKHSNMFFLQTNKAQMTHTKNSEALNSHSSSVLLLFPSILTHMFLCLLLLSNWLIIVG